VESGRIGGPAPERRQSSQAAACTDANDTSARVAEGEVERRIGPAEDPAGVRASAEAGEALAAISRGAAPFVSRGDDSGTHKLELKLWEQAGLAPSGSWYQESGQGMGQTIQIAAEKAAYTIADRATYLATEDTSGLEVLLEGDPALLNIYHVIEVTTRAGKRVNEEGGRAFAEWIVSQDAQTLIDEFGRAEFGRSLFTPDAGKGEEAVAASP
jgi:tungstate transport system substrate-binding protein